MCFTKFKINENVKKFKEMASFRIFLCNCNIFLTFILKQAIFIDSITLLI